MTERAEVVVEFVMLVAVVGESRTLLSISIRAAAVDRVVAVLVVLLLLLCDTAVVESGDGLEGLLCRRFLTAESLSVDETEMLSNA